MLGNFILTLLFIFSSSVRAGDFDFKIYLKKEGWYLQNRKENEEFKMVSERFNGKNSDEIDIYGLGLRGEHAHVFMLPIWNKNKEPINIPYSRVQIEPEKLFKNQILATNKKSKAIFLDGDFYNRRKIELKSGLQFDFYFSNDKVLDYEVVQNALNFFSEKFPEKSTKIKNLQVVALLNSEEKFDTLSKTWITGFYSDDFVILTSHDGNGTFLHRMHELGGLFRIRNLYGHGLTWFIAFDQNFQKEKANNEQAARCALLNRFERYFSQVVNHAGDLTVDQIMKKYISLNAYAIYAWGSALLWQKINSQLEDKNLYDLIRHIQKLEIMSAKVKPGILGLTDSYGDISPSVDFYGLVDSYFMKRTLRELLLENEMELAQIGCSQTAISFQELAPSSLYHPEDGHLGFK